MQVVLTCACIASRFGMASCAHGGNAKRNEPVPEGCRFPGRKDLSDIGKTKSESRNALDQRAIIKEREWVFENCDWSGGYLYKNAYYTG